eukprot:Partr_v1_DN28979_c0_g2_i1_m25347 putative Testis expressed 10
MFKREKISGRQFVCGACTIDSLFSCFGNLKIEKMPKTSQRKKQRKSQDFVKTKLKVGKRVGTPHSSTDTSFKARSIHVPSQNIRVDLDTDADDRALIMERLSQFSALMHQLNHPSASSRLGAIGALRDLLLHYPQIAHSQISRIFSGPLKLMLDMESGIRKALLAFFGDICPLFDSLEISPHFSSVIVYTCSAMTHINERVRVDSLKFLQIWIEQFPDLVVNAAALKLIPNLISALHGDKSSAGSASKASVVTVGPESAFVLSSVRLMILQNLYRCMQMSLDVGVLETGGGVSSFSDVVPLVIASGELPAFVSLQYRQLSAPIAGLSFSAPRLNDQRVGKVGEAIGQLLDSQHLFFELWTECLPGVFAVNSVVLGPASSALKVILELLSSVLGYCADGEGRFDVSAVAKSVQRWCSPHFPFGSSYTAAGLKNSRSYVVDLNLLYCSVVASFACCGAVCEDDNILSDVVEFISSCIQSPSSDSGRAGQLLTSAHANLIMSTIRHLDRLPQAHKESQPLFEKVMDFSCSKLLPADCRAPTFDFVNSYVFPRLLEGCIIDDWSFAKQDRVKKWILSLPRLLWEACDSGNLTRASELTKTLLIYLRNSTDSFRQENFSRFQKMMMPMFRVRTKNGGECTGPFAKTGIEIQTKILAICSVLDMTDSIQSL